MPGLQNVILPSIKPSGTVQSPPVTPSPTTVTPPSGPPAAPTTPAENVVTATYSNQAQAAAPVAPAPQPNLVQTVPTAEQLANIDPSTISYYNVTVTDVFQYAGITFRPGRIWQVAPHLYAGKLDDGTAFADHCSQVLPQPKA